jgi:hypothetical protein
VGYGNGRFVAVGNRSTLASSDGTQWTQRDLKSPAQLEAVIYGNGLFVAVGWAYDVAVGFESDIATSTNGIDWVTTMLYPPDVPQVIFGGIAYGTGRFVAVGSIYDPYASAWSATSSNGIDWTTQPTGFASHLNGITYADGLFVAVGRDYQFIPDTQETRILTSEDGLNWTQRDVWTVASLYGVTYGNGQFVAVGGSDWFGDPLIFTSKHGVKWEQRNYTGSYYDYLNLDGVAYGNGRFVATGGFSYGDSGLADILTSTNGIHWDRDPTPTNISPAGVVWGAGTFVAVGGYGEILSSTNGLDWTNHLQGFYGLDWELNGVAASSNLVVAVGSSQQLEQRGDILTSANGIDWMSSLSARPFQDVIHAQGKFVAVWANGPHAGGAGGVDSGDGVNWTEVHYSDSALYAITYGNGTFVAVGGQCDDYQNSISISATSTDGETWTSHDAGTNGLLQAVAFGNGVFVAVGAGDIRNNDCFFYGYPVTSTDGAHWTTAKTDTAESFWASVAFGNGRFVIANLDGDIWTSFDGHTWVHQTNIAAPYPNKIIYANHTFFHLPSGSTSLDGINWTSHYVGAGFNGLAYANGTYFGVGYSGAILQSDPVPPDNPSCQLGLMFGAFPELALYGGANRAIRIESSSDLGAPNSWRALTNLYPTRSPFSWTDPRSPPLRQRFYRAVILP